MQTKWIVKKYQNRIKRMLKDVREYLITKGETVSEVYFTDGDYYSWGMLVGDRETGIDISFEICESDRFGDGDDGINFALNIVAVGGEIVGGITPYNYTPKCWVSTRNKEAVERRFEIVEDASRRVAGEIYNLIVEFRERRSSPAQDPPKPARSA